jgi:predicted TIM-barrel fold metal-dependent hydrolase
MSPLDTLRARVLDKTARYAILNLYYGVELIRHPDWAAALASACNDWLMTNWLDKDPRLRAGIVVDPKYPDLAANEIDRASKHPGFVQVLLPVRSEVPYGNRRYAPLLEHAVSAGLAVGIQFGGFTGNATTPVGWPSTYFEDYVGMITAFQAQVLSLIVEGTFERLPGLKIALLEAGWTWMPSFLWRMDKDWKGFRREAPWVGAPPSAYVRKHFHATVQPMDASPQVASLLPYVEQIGSDAFLLFASEYPHRHATPARELLDLLSPVLRGKIEHDNAAKLYDFDRATSVKTATTSPTPA